MSFIQSGARNGQLFQNIRRRATVLTGDTASIGLIGTLAIDTNDATGEDGAMSFSTLTPATFGAAGMKCVVTDLLGNAGAALSTIEVAIVSDDVLIQSDGGNHAIGNAMSVDTNGQTDVTDTGEIVVAIARQALTSPTAGDTYRARFDGRGIWSWTSA